MKKDEEWQTGKDEAAQATTPWQARTAAATKTEMGFINFLVNDAKDTTSSSGTLTSFAKFKRYAAFMKKSNKEEASFAFFSVHK